MKVKVKKIAKCPECKADTGLLEVWETEGGNVMGGIYQCQNHNGRSIQFPAIGEVIAEELRDDTIIFPDEAVLV